jgi:predicted dehydrogenase
MITTQVQNTSPVNKTIKTRYAVVDLGAFARSDVLPAFADAENSELVALVSGDATKRNGEERFREVAEMTSVIMRFPDDRLATFSCSFGAIRIQTYQVVGTKGDLRLELAYSTQGPIEHILTIDGKAQKHSFEAHNQVVAELVYFSDCIAQNKEPEPSGTEGLTDVQIIRALYKSIETGGFVDLEDFNRSSNSMSQI